MYFIMSSKYPFYKRMIFGNITLSFKMVLNKVEANGL